MAEAAVTVEREPLTKFRALAYMERVGQPVTAKMLAIDTDSRASTGSELLERMTSQGLVTRDEKQRPREYVLTDAGRKRLEFFRSTQASARVPDSTGANPGPDADANPKSDPGPAERSAKKNAWRRRAVRTARRKVKNPSGRIPQPISNAMP